MIQAGFAEVDVTPSGSCPLAGYFNPRPSTGVLDPLYAKAVVLSDGQRRVAVVALDSIGIWRHDARAIREAVFADGTLLVDEVLITATHTHTAPAPVDLFNAGAARPYVEGVLRPGAVRAIREAARACREVDLAVGEAQERGLAFIRRYWMSDGRVMTNPPKGDPRIVRPEGQPDHTVRTLSFHRNGELPGLIVCATNHCDTVGGERISADWPGQMAGELKKHLGRNAPVMLLNGFAGDVNHFDRQNPAHQASYEEAQRIGRAYAAFALESIRSAKAAAVDRLACGRAVRRIPLRPISAEEVSRARELLARPMEQGGRRLTSEELAKGDPAVERLFAAQLLALAEEADREAEPEVEIAALALGDHAFVFLPGEPFTELGVQIRAASPFATTTMVELYEHFFGYIPMPEHFVRGGYEPRTTMHNRLSREAGPILVEAAVSLLNHLHVQALQR